MARLRRRAAVAAERKRLGGVCGGGDVAGVQARRARKEGYGGGGTMSEEKLGGVVMRFPILFWAERFVRWVAMLPKLFSLIKVVGQEALGLMLGVSTITNYVRY